MNDLAREELLKAESVIFKRDFTDERRRELAAKGWALPGGSYPVETAADLHPAAVLIRSGHGDTEAATALVARRAKQLGAPNPLAADKSEKVQKAEVEFSYTVPLRKSDVEGKFYGVVLEPDLPDAHGDVFGAPAIEEAAHAFMRDYAMSKAEHSPDVQHGGGDAGADLLENYVAPVDMELGGQPVTKSSWVQAWQINDPLVKAEINEGKLTGLSLEGIGTRHSLEVS